MSYTTLYRPTGLQELRLIIESDWKRFPPRLTWQPIFYPVLNQQYAEQIAAEWNSQDAFSGYCGVVTRFEVDDLFLSKYSTQNVGGSLHDELWVPAEELEALNDNIKAGIRVVSVFFGEQFVMPEDPGLIEELQKFKQ